MCPFVSLHVDLHLDVWQLVLGDFKWFVCHYYFLEELASERRQSLRGSRNQITAATKDDVINVDLQLSKCWC